MWIVRTCPTPTNSAQSSRLNRSRPASGDPRIMKFRKRRLSRSKACCTKAEYFVASCRRAGVSLDDQQNHEQERARVVVRVQ